VGLTNAMTLAVGKQRAKVAEALAARRVRQQADGLDRVCWSMIFSENRFPLFGIML
jgi:hypothetical protein